jgi:hypothetical protein
MIRRLESGDPVPHVPHPAALSIFAVARNVDSDFGLLANHLRDSGSEMFGENVLIEWLAHRLRAHLVDDFRSFDEAADMGSENSIRTAFHTITSRESHPGKLSRLNRDLLLQYLPD